MAAVRRTGVARGARALTAIQLEGAGPADLADIDALLDAAFGPERHARTAALLRAGSTPIAGPSLIARGGDGALLGSIQFWPVVLDDGAGMTPLTLLGPVAVAANARALGLGRRLLAASLARADAVDLGPIVLIGDASYYGPFGFAAAGTAEWELPGPVERHRLLLRNPDAVPLPQSARLAAPSRTR